MLDDIVAKINYVRTRPQEYASKRLVPMLKKYNGKDFYLDPKQIIATQEGIAPCKECIQQLKKQKPLPPLTMDKSLCISASMHVKDQSKTGQVGHQGSNGSWSEDRMESRL